ncbi:MAG: sulfite exporter TauE/SafE family protein [Actinobacteria bacterium]|nr:sulfite exporter TauE/SafE family protein [Actinomycetota bacterium]
MIAGIVDTGLASWWAPALAFAAGVVSFASPCVFPLVPGYLSFVSGGQTSEESRPIFPMLLFIAGFAAVFTSLGAFTQVLRPLLSDPLAVRIAGAIVIVFGVAMLLYAFRLGWPGLYAERRPLLSRIRPGPAGAFPLGMAFAAGWTPCIGPVLGGILTLAAAQGGSVRGALLLFVYSLGLGVPFLLVGLGVRRLMSTLSFVKRNYHWFAGVSGAVMVALGVLIVSGLWTRLLAPLLRVINRFSPPI